MSIDPFDKLKLKKLCYNCIGEDYLSNKVKKQGKRVRCSYCGETRKCCGIGILAEYIKAAFEQHYIRTSDQPNSWQYSLLCDKESVYEWERDGEPVVYAIMNAADISEDAAEDIQKILENEYYDFDCAMMNEETEFSKDSYYEEKSQSDANWQEEWFVFERSLRTEARFFSRTAAKVLASIFDGIDGMVTHDGRSLIINAGPGADFNSVYRARVFQSDEKLQGSLGRPDMHLGPPPSFLARAGRMNAQGISVFYGTNESSAAIAEVRPPVGSRVAVACFEIIKPLRLLDFTAFNTINVTGSIFDPSFASKLMHAMFLRSLSQRIIRPVMPDDESFEYLTTQAVADFLATELSTPLDGIVFPSIQAAGDALNVILFHKAAQVEEIKLPEGAKVEVRTTSQDEDGWHIDYSVTEIMPRHSESLPAKNVEHVDCFFEFETISPLIDKALDRNWSNPSLRIVLDSIKVHVVQCAQYETEVYDVTRYRFNTTFAF